MQITARSYRDEVAQHRRRTNALNRPNFFILGAPKCGTTAMAQWLGANPHIYMSPIKEPHYYSDFNNRYADTERGYLSLFENATPAHLAIGEASVWYLYSPNAVAKILQDIPDAKFIVCLRNPVDMAYSLHSQLLRCGDEPIKDFRTAWEAQALRARRRKVPLMCRDSRLLLYGPICRLGKQLSRLLECVPGDRVMPILLDDLRTDPARCYRDVLRFLDVSYDGRSQFGIVNGAQERRYPRLHVAIREIYRTRKRLHLPRTYLGMAFRPFHRWNMRPSSRPPLDENMRSELRRYFMPDINELEHLLGRNLDAWKDGIS